MNIIWFSIFLLTCRTTYTAIHFPKGDLEVYKSYDQKIVNLVIDMDIRFTSQTFLDLKRDLALNIPVEGLSKVEIEQIKEFYLQREYMGELLDKLVELLEQTSKLGQKLPTSHSSYNNTCHNVVNLEFQNSGNSHDMMTLRKTFLFFINQVRTDENVKKSPAALALLPEFQRLMIYIAHITEKLEQVYLQLSQQYERLNGLFQAKLLHTSHLAKLNEKGFACNGNNLKNSKVNYIVNQCTYEVDNKVAVCEITKETLGELENFILYKPFFYNGCSIDLSYYARSINSEKFELEADKPRILLPLNKHTDCIKSIDNLDKDGILEYCPKTQGFKKYELSPYGLAFYQLDKADRTQFPGLLDDDKVQPPLFLRLKGTYSYIDEAGHKLTYNFKSSHNGAIAPKLNFTESNLCKNRPQKKTWIEVVDSIWPYSILFTLQTLTLFCLYKLGRKVWDILVKGNIGRNMYILANAQRTNRTGSRQRPPRANSPRQDLMAHGPRGSQSRSGSRR